MNSSKVVNNKTTWLLTALSIIVTLVCNSQHVKAINIQSSSSEGADISVRGIFSRMSDEMTKPERIINERHQATLRKKAQLEDAE